ncbi:type III polyketide synthase [Metabacillus iocasae]|uniref:Alkylresorcinol/alkylpyrone synthase n=1 Tax=Priestia iocasae TaxID=2291674 RepID=A0ABS2QUX1_9BACI|nr:3-oxoacyl-[acyl-carrier-protein] synthase III C-terminal domain-containing protein [Metabacillus iocasae]MBM7703259.1 alkylresorcinol/alkylpyrone synthase [Metabacillus iocasae]
MPKVVSVGLCIPPYELKQEDTVLFAKELFAQSFKDINRLLTVFANGQIEKRHFAKDLSWFKTDHTFEEKNNEFIKCAVEFGAKAITSCLQDSYYLNEPISYEEIDAIFYISTSGLSTPSIEARIMNKLPFSDHTKRIPIWGLGCAGGAAGLSRAYEYCLAFPNAKVLVLSIELCSLTFQRNDRSKSNLIGTSLFADGVAAVLMAGDHVDLRKVSTLPAHPSIVDVQSTLMPQSEDVMGWDIKNNGLYVIFSKDIPTIVETWLGNQVHPFLQQNDLTISDLTHFVAHPGGKKVLEAYVSSLQLSSHMIEYSLDVLKQYGNMSSTTVLYVLDRFMRGKTKPGEYGIVTALGPGFSSELLLLKWE